MDVVREFQRGAVRVHVLHQATNADIHGARLSGELARLGYAISPGTLYPLLSRLEKAGLLSSRTEVVEGHQRRCYRTTAAGRRALAACRKAVWGLAAEVLAPQ